MKLIKKGLEASAVSLTLITTATAQSLQPILESPFVESATSLWGQFIMLLGL